MDDRLQMETGGTGRGFNTFFNNLFAFCADVASTCFSHDADKPCVVVGLCSLSALLLLLSCLVSACQRRKCCAENPGEAITMFYCFIGNLCGTVGAILSKQLYIQVLMSAFAAAVDVVSFLSRCLPVFLCWNTMTERKLRMMRKRRRQHLLAVCVLMVIAGGFLKSRVTEYPANRPISDRRLLHVVIQDNTEILGYTLGLISFVIACTSKFPALCKAYRGHVLTQANLFSGLLCSLAGALYTAAILLYDTQLEFFARVMPWLLSAICGIILDLLILVLHWCKRGTRKHPVRFSADMHSLLGRSRALTQEKAVTKKHKKQKVNSSAETKSNDVQKLTEMGRYMDVTIHPATKEAMLFKQEQGEDGSLNRLGRLIRVNSFCFSDTSYDSSLVSSDLEWDFEEVNGQWRKPSAIQQEGNKFPSLQECPGNHKPFHICTCTMSRLPQKTKEGDGNVFAVSCEK